MQGSKRKIAVFSGIIRAMRSSPKQMERMESPKRSLSYLTLFLRSTRQLQTTLAILTNFPYYGTVGKTNSFSVDTVINAAVRNLYCHSSAPVSASMQVSYTS